MLSREVFAVAVRVVPNVFGVLFSLKVSFQCIMIIQRKQGQEPDLEVLDPSAEQAPPQISVNHILRLFAGHP